MSIFYDTLKILILPPGLIIILLVVGLCLFRMRRLSFVLLFSATLFLYLLSINPVTNFLACHLERYAALTDEKIIAAHAQAIVVLSGGRYKSPPEYGSVDQASIYELMRLQYAAYLYRKTHLPILVSGGFCLNQDASEAQVMAGVLRDSFHVPVKWVENHSENTWQNARYSIAILQAHKINRAFIVTDAIHMPRSMWSFQQDNFTPIAAPTHFFTTDLQFVSPLVPNAESLRKSIFCLYEYFGLVLYQLEHP